MVLKLLLLFMGWNFIYFMPYNVSSFFEFGMLGPFKEVYWKFLHIKSEPFIFLLQGSKVHLWFLVSLILCIIISTTLICLNLKRSLVALAIALYAFAVFGSSYSHTRFGIPIEFNPRNGPFFGLLLFVTGYLLAHKSIDTCWAALGSFTFLIGLCIHFFEIYYLTKAYQTSLFQEFVFGTYLMGLGAALISISNHHFFSSEITARAGKMTLGIYASHFIFIDILTPIDEWLNNPFWEVFYVFLVFALSLGTTLLLSKTKYGKKLVE